MFFFIFAHFFHIHRCHNFANKIRRHDLTSFLESPSSVDFLQKVSVLHGFSFRPNKHHEVFRKSKFSQKNTKIRRNSRKFEETFLFFRKFHFCRAKQNIFHFFQDFFHIFHFHRWIQLIIVINYTLQTNSQTNFSYVTNIFTDP